MNQLIEVLEELFAKPVMAASIRILLTLLLAFVAVRLTAWSPARPV